MFNDGDVYVGKIVCQNHYRNCSAVRFALAAVPLGPELLAGVIWDRCQEYTGRPALDPSHDAAQTGLVRASSSGRFAAVALLAVGDGPKWSGASTDGTGPASVVVLDLYVLPALVAAGGPVMFPGGDTLKELAETLVFHPDHIPTEGSNGEA